MKDTIKRMIKQTTDWQEIFETLTFDRKFHPESKFSQNSVKKFQKLI